MTQALAALQWTVAVALFVLGMLTVVDWLRHRGRTRRYLAAAVGFLGIIALLGRAGRLSGVAAVILGAVSIFLLMASALGFALFRHSLIPMRRWALSACVAGVGVVTAVAIAVNLDPTTSTNPPPFAVAIDIALLFSWCVVVGAAIWRLWRVSGGLPRVQRARLRSLNAGFAGLILAILGVIATVGLSSLALQIAVESVVLLSMPLLAVALSPPGWLRRVWRESEEIQLRHALNNLLLFSPDEETLAARALEWAARLLGGGAAMLALDGRVLALNGISEADGDRLHRELQGMRNSGGLSFTSALGAAAVVPLHAQAGDGYLAVLAGPFTPLFGDEELARLGQYAVSITVALDRVHLVVGMRRNAELLDLAYDAVFTWDFDTREIQYWNRAASQLYGYSRDEARGKDPLPLLQSEYSIPLEAIVAALRENNHWEGELRQVTKDGRVLDISARWAVQRDTNGRPAAVLEINRDISNEKRAADELRHARDAAEQASNAKSEYLSRMSHELRTPLAAMLGFSDLLEMREPREDQLSAIDAIQRAGSHLLSLVNDVLDIARIEAGRETLSLQPQDVRAVLEECVGLVTQTANERRMTLSMRIDGPDRIYVRADRQRLVQVLLNLLTNAIKYGTEGGHVIAGAAARDGAVEIDVIDDGPGLDETEQQRLFQPFERLGAERGNIQGTGLGLALARQLTVAMGGTLALRSSKGDGATFTVRLQQATGTDAATVIAAAGPPVLRDAVSERTVLYVEDNLATISLVESIFALRPNVRLLTAMQGGLAVDLAREHCPDLVILDLHLPDLNGDEVLRRLRHDKRTASIPVVIYSADATEPQVRRLLSAGALAFLTKPARVTELLELIDGVLGHPAEVRAQLTGDGR
ncbi:MAG: ATP-binding protein [Candidatus Dormibacteraeota bacterium]|nr:ATP-binding protein [Candidatus Dormibacteraeota bacterium]